jgi:hypothetical protein
LLAFGFSSLNHITYDYYGNAELWFNNPKDDLKSILLLMGGSYKIIIVDPNNLELFESISGNSQDSLYKRLLQEGMING